MHNEGPVEVDTKGFIPMKPFCSGLHLPVFVDPPAWEAVVRFNPYGAIEAMTKAIDAAIAGAGANKEFIDFRVWAGDTKQKRRRLRASIYIQENKPWILITQAPQKAKRGLALSRKKLTT